MTTTLVQSIASRIQARINCIQAGNTDWKYRHEEIILEFVRDYMPSGSGFDSGTKIDLDASTGDKIVFNTSYHHMDESGYDGWTEHTVTVTPSLAFGFYVKVSGRNRNDIKDYIATEFREALIKPTE